MGWNQVSLGRRQSHRALVTFAVLIAAFLYNQRRLGDAAALPPRILKNRSVIAGAIFGLCTNSAINVLEYYLPTYYQIVRGYSPSESGYMMIPIVVGATIGMLLCGSGTSTIGYYTPFMLFSSVAMPIFAGLITTFGVNTSFARLIMYSGVSGFASGVAFNAPITAVQTVLFVEDTHLGFLSFFSHKTLVLPSLLLLLKSFSRINSRLIWLAYSQTSML